MGMLDIYNFKMREEQAQRVVDDIKIAAESNQLNTQGILNLLEGARLPEAQVKEIVDILQPYIKIDRGVIEVQIIEKEEEK